MGRMSASPSEPEAQPSFDATIELIRRYHKGEQGVLDELCERYWPRVLTVVRHRIGPALRGLLEAEDIVQETFEAALPKLAEFEVRHDAAFIQWLAKVAERRIQSAARAMHAQKRDHRREVALDARGGSNSSSMSWQLVASEVDAPERLAQAELAALVDECVDELPEDQREVILLRDFAGGDWPFVAKELGRPTPSAARELHRRARIRLTVMVGRRLGREGSS